MNIAAWCYFPARLAWRQLVFDRTKLIAAMFGVMFACVLVFMQLGFRDSLYDSAISAPLKLTGDLFLMHKQTEAMWRPVRFPRRELMRALGHPAVMEVTPMYLSLAPFKNIETRVKRTLMVYGFDPDSRIFDIADIRDQHLELRLKDTVLFDEYSRPEFGPMRRLLETGRNVTEINDYKVNVVGLFRLGVSFAADGNAVTSDLNFMRIFPNRNHNAIDMGVIMLHPGSSPSQVQAELRRQLNEFVDIFTYEQLLRHEKDYWANMAPIGFIFGFGTIMGLVVGLVIVEPWLVVLLILAIVPAFLSELKFSQAGYSLAKRWTPERRMLSYLSYIGATNESAKEIKLFNLSGYISARFTELADRFYKDNRSLSIRRAAWGTLFNLIGNAAY
ncbi:MAG: ABC transporter permease DevC, partial [Nitrosomonas sp.]